MISIKSSEVRPGSDYLFSFGPFRHFLLHFWSGFLRSFPFLLLFSFLSHDCLNSQILKRTFFFLTKEIRTSCGSQSPTHAKPHASFAVGEINFRQQTVTWSGSSGRVAPSRVSEWHFSIQPFIHPLLLIWATREAKQASFSTDPPFQLHWGVPKAFSVRLDTPSRFLWDLHSKSTPMKYLGIAWATSPDSSHLYRNNRWTVKPSFNLGVEPVTLATSSDMLR